MKQIIIKISIITLISISIFGQSKQTMKSFKPNNKDVLIRLEKIYNNLEYNTTAFNDLKNKWIITDPLYVREIYNKCIVRNALKIDGEKIDLSTLKEKTKDIYNGSVFIELRKRYYDNEIEELRFFTESKFENMKSMYESDRDYFFDKISDNVYIKSILGEDIYHDLSNQFYAHTDLTKEAFGNKEAYNFDINLHLFESYLMFWSQTTQNNNKYLLSFSSNWGNDNIIFPGWYYPDIFAGLKLSYVDYIRNNEPYLSYYFEVGMGVPVRFPKFEFNSDEFGPRLFHSGDNVLMRMGGNPFMLISPDLEDLQLTLEAMISLTEYKSDQYNLEYISQFFSNRNFVNINVAYNNIFNFIDFGWFYSSLGYTNYDIYHYFYDPTVTKVQTISKQLDHTINAEVGILNTSNLLQNKISLSISHNFSSSYTYAGLKAKFMINNIIGFEFKFYSNIYSSGSLPYYRVPNYITFSPIIRINY